MIPTNLAKSLNGFYENNFPLVRPLLINGINQAAGRSLSLIDAYVLVNFTKSIGENAVEFVSFVEQMLNKFREVEIYFNTQVKLQSDHKDAIARPGGWAGHGCLPIALALYSNNRNGVKGNYIECGVFRGGALACISHACKYLGVTALGADTFEGLPANDETGYWNKGQFLGTLEDVKNAVEKIGAPDSITYLKGLFSETLKDLSEPISVIFLDTDLYDSSMSALTAMRGVCSKDTLYFSDGVSGKRDFLGGVFSPAQNEAKAINDYFNRMNNPIHAVWTGNGNMGVFKHKIVDEEFLSFSTSFVSYLSKCFYFPSRFKEHIYVKGRADSLGISNEKSVTEDMFFDYCGSELIQETIASNYYIGHLEWLNNNSY